MRKSRKLGFLAGIAAIAMIGVLAISNVRADLLFDQRHRDLARVLSDIVHRAHSMAALGEVVRPEAAVPAITLAAPDLHDGWVPTCEVPVTIAGSDPTRYLLSLVLVPRDRLGEQGASFTAYSFFSGEPALTADALAPPFADWLVGEEGGFSDIEADANALLAPSRVEVETNECDGFSFYVISGEAR
ncbi:hypothetical protein V8J82_19765 [Gymnodinialimonas sp. 2305UL16-5]|uniref:hypothetical protein n=1 Tax=Gymnodinialimonas mytili TaxID=3126503 RepID=UPI00309635B1